MQLLLFLFACAERTADIRGRSVRGDCGGQHGRHSVNCNVEVWQTISHEVLHNASSDCWSVLLARDVIYTSRAYATMSVSVCLSVCL